ncbi:MAG: ankyrin repeat domain-containing protein [Mesorhizobium sp.]|nr:MAG: ankyrin repeat domain-containing protein [Mesorhizobium sp.]
MKGSSLKGAMVSASWFCEAMACITGTAVNGTPAPQRRAGPGNGQRARIVHSAGSDMVRPLSAVAFWFGLTATAAMAGPLHDAAQSGDETALKALLDGGAAIDEKNPTGETALVVACLASRPEAVAFLIKRGADVVARNNRGMTALHGASYAGCAECVRQLLVAGAAPSDAENRFKTTPFIVAAEENHPDILAMLLAAGADSEETERHGFTALTRAGFKARKETIAFLLARGGRCQPAKVAGGWSGECLKLAAETARSTLSLQMKGRAP